MGFEKKTWKDRLVEFAGRRTLTNTSTQESMVVDVARNEGLVSQEGDAFSAANMNDLEDRIEAEFNELNSNLDSKFPVPDYGNKTVISSNTYTVTEDGYVSLYVSKASNGTYGRSSCIGQININGAVAWYCAYSVSNDAVIYPADRSGPIPVKAGDVVTFSIANTDSYERAFYPVR